PDADGQAALSVGFFCHLFADEEVVFECVFQFFCCSFAVDGGVDFEVELKAANVHVGGPDAADQAVNSHGLCVEKSVLVCVASCSCGGHFAQIGVSCPVDKRVVRFARDHNP